MYINPKTAIEKGWIKFPVWMDEEYQQKCIQPNAIDFTVDALYRVNTSTDFVISEEKKKMRGVVQLELDNGFWHIGKGSYDFMSDFYVNVPEGVAAQLIIRSTFNRNGLFLTSGLYDSGFQGNVAGMLHNIVGFSIIGQKTRIGQIIFINSGTSSLYAGGYNTENGQHWTTIK